MKRSPLLLLLVLAIASLSLAACGQQPAGDGDAGEVAPPQPPAEYAAMTNPFAGDATAAATGQVDYESYCQSCHGSGGKGDGPAASSLDPKPGNLAELVKTASDGYIFWRVAEGGMMAPFNSSMPAWKDVLNQDQIWQVVTYIETFN
ncbi:MAG: cytochrome c [Anaerolineae bacterium]|nr:cytochrome c [Anaerolineae bacterium]